MMSGAAWQRFLPDLHRITDRMPKSARIQGACTKWPWLPDPRGDNFDITQFSGVIEHDAEDQVVVVWAGTCIADLQTELARRGQCLPLPQTGHALVDGVPGTVGGLISMNMPHGLSAQAGQIKDWVLGLAIMRQDGTWARCGSKAVKSVAGYDIQRLFAGSRGALGLIGAATFRTAPIKNEFVSEAEAICEWRSQPCWIQRVLPTDYLAAREQADLFAADPASGTLWHKCEPTRFQDDWLMGPRGVIDPPSAPAELLSRAKQVFDPQNRFNPHITL